MATGPPVPFSALPLDTEQASTKLNAWGAYGPHDELGFLNRQTDAIIAAAAASEIKTGQRVSLNADMEFQGKHVDHKIITRQHLHGCTSKSIVDKSVCLTPNRHFNTQSSTQWDGLRHFGYQAAQRFYNNTTLDDIAGTSDKSQINPHILGIQNVSRQGIFGRAIVVDFRRWITPGNSGHDVVHRETNGTGYQHFQRSGIKLSWLKACLEFQGTQVRFGDILIIRTGFFAAFKVRNVDDWERLYTMQPPTLGGVHVTDDFLEWVWDHFSAVAGDQPGFEQIPMEQPVSAHEVLLAGWGCSIGELFDLEALSVGCEKLGRWSFFLSSEVLNVSGGVASPANAVANAVAIF